MKSKKDENQFEILLINPPLWYYQSVPPDITAAAALLHHQGVGTKIRDLNLESFHYFFGDVRTSSLILRTLNCFIILNI